MYFILLEGKGFFWLGKSKLNLCGEKAAILAALDHKGSNLFPCFLRDSHAFEALDFEALNSLFVLIAHGFESGEGFVQFADRRAMVLRASVGHGEKGEGLFVREHLFRFHVVYYHTERLPQALFYSVLIFFFYGN